jgi:hypothetical protein
MDQSLYRTAASTAATLAFLPALPALLLALVIAPVSGCKKDSAGASIGSAEQGKLRRIAANLEEAYANAPLPNLTESPRLADRVDKWDDFRSCTVRTYVARKRDFHQRAREGRARSQRHASIGDETVEECAVQLAVANKDHKICERLAAEYRGPNGEMPLSAVRCWDTRARVFGLPEECPVVWMPWDAPARNPECVALARRDQSLCPFADSPGRCRALLTGDSASCGAQDGAPDCLLALEYWRDLIPAGFGPPLIDPELTKDKPLSVSFDLKWARDEYPHIRIEAPKSALGVSWPAGKTKPAYTEDTTQYWGAKLSPDAVEVSWSTGKPSVKLAFLPAGAPSGVRPLKPPSPTAPATFIAVWDDPAKFRRCQPGPETTGQLQFDAGQAQPGSLVTGVVKADKLECSDGSRLALNVEMRMVIIDVR